MDDDTKTLLAILALVYGSSNGVGLFKAALDDVQKEAGRLRTAGDAGTADPSFVRGLCKRLLVSLWSFEVIVYLAMVILPPLFLVAVVWLGAEDALSIIGLGGTATTSSAIARGAPFYWILLILSLLSATQLLAEYFAGWRQLIGSWSSTKTGE